MAIVTRCLLVLGLLATFPALAQQEPQQEPPGRVGRVSVIAGTLAFYGPGDSEWSAAAVNLPAATGGWFATDPKSRAQLRIGPDTVNLAEDTQLNIAELRDGVMQLALSQGRIGLQLHRPAWRKDQTAEIDIARGGIWLLQPGEYDIDAGAPDRPTRISVFEGSARFVGGGVDKVVKAGERLVLTGAETLTAMVERNEPDDFADWCHDHGIRQDRVAAARRVSPAMTGFEELEDHGEWAEAADLGAVWYPKSLPADWTPYRAGRWVWVEPWGWNWIDDQPWGFAPFHYGRWAQVNERWGWVPGEFVAQPVYAPALVAFIAQPAVEVAVAADAGPPVGWFPLAPGEVYWPSYTRNPTYIRNVNITNVRISVINQVTTAMLTRRGATVQPPIVLNQRFVNRPAATIVPAEIVMRSAPVAPAVVRVPDRELLRRAQVAALPPAVVARPAVTAAVAVAAAPRDGRQPPAARPSAGAPNAVTPAQPHPPARPNFAQLARAPRLGHGAAAAIRAALPGAATAPAGSPHRPGDAPVATAVIPPPAPHQPPAAANAAPPIRPGPPGRPYFANLPRWRPQGGPQQPQPGVQATPNAGLPETPSGPASADPAARRQTPQDLAQQRAVAAAAARQQLLGQRAAQQQAIAEQRAAREQAKAAQLAQQRAAAEAAGHHQAQQRIARQQAIAEQRAAREQAKAAQLGQQRAASEAAQGQLTEQRAARQQSIIAQQAQQRATAEASRQHQAQQRAAQQQAMQRAAAQRAAQQQAAAAQQAQQRAAQQQQAATQRAAQQQAAQQQAAHRAAQQQAAHRAAQQAAQQAAAQRAQQQAAAAQQAQQRAAQQAAAQRAAQQQAMAAQQAQQRAAQQQQKQAQKRPPCGGPGQPACPQH